jgi:hypothetical protein
MEILEEEEGSLRPAISGKQEEWIQIIIKTLGSSIVLVGALV